MNRLNLRHLRGKSLNRNLQPVLQSNISLQHYNTFGIDASAKLFGRFDGADVLASLLDTSEAKQHSLLVLGGGSNILLTKDFDGLVLKNEIPGIEVLTEDETHVWVKAGAGVNWHQFVLYCIEKGFAGIENLSLIPGNVGASPMQNIGAYGVEIKDVFESLEAWDKEDKKLVSFNKAECMFGYRESVFKNRYKDRFVILSVTFRLNKYPDFHVAYGAIKEELERAGVQELTIRAVSDAVIRIRQSKLPDPKEIGNAGSFFKNPVISTAAFDQLKSANPSIPSYTADNGDVKVPAGWLIEQAGWKGYRSGDAGVHAKQALVLVNYGNAKGAEIVALAGDIIQSVSDKYGITLHREVNIV